MGPAHSAGKENKPMSESVRERTQILDEIAAQLAGNEDVEGAMRLLFSELSQRRSQLSPEAWRDCIALECQQQPLLDLLHQDPLTARAFFKPRGYAGDADMLDLIYAIEDGEHLPALQSSSALGRKLYHATANVAAARAVRSRRWILSEALDALASRMAGAHVLSLACGHLREARHCSALLQGRFGRFVAADQDRESLAVVKREVGGFGVEAVNTSVRALLRGQDVLGSFDFIYATGLYDYLSQSVAKQLTACLFAMLNPGGRLLLANFLPTSSSTAYMEAYMEWWLIYRTRAEMLDLLEPLPEGDLGHCHTFTEENENIVFLEVERSR
jgi:hypothetical protein